MIIQHSKALILDMGGVTHPRHPFQAEGLINRVRFGSGTYKLSGEIPNLDRKIDNSPLTASERVSYIYHLIGSFFIFPDIKELLPVLARHADIFLFTGLPNKEPFTILVDNAFKRTGTDVFKHKYLTPTGVSILVNKIATIEELKPLYKKGLTIIDNDPTKTIPIKLAHPDADVINIDDLSASILFWKIKNPGVRRVKTFRHATKRLIGR